MRKYASLIAVLLCTIAASAQSSFSISNNFKISGNGGWDYLAVQPNSNKLFVSHGTQVNIIDKTTGDSLGIIPNTIGVHGITFIPALNNGYTSNGRLNNVFVFDLNTFSIKDSIATGKNPDAIFYDAYSKRLITCNGSSNDLTIIDPVASKVIATIPVDGKPETAVSNGSGKIFVNIEDKNEIVVVDINALKLVAHWTLSPGEAPTGLSIDNDNHRLFTACSDNNKLEILDAETGKIIKTLAIEGHCDGVGFDAALKNIYTSNGEGTLTVVHQDSKDNYTIAATVPTKRGARTIAVDEKTHAVYLPTAAFDNKTTASGRPNIIPGTFEVMQVSQQ